MLQYISIFLLFIGLVPIRFAQCEQSEDLTKKLETPHFILKYDEAPGALDGLGQFLESRIEKVLAGLNVKPERKILMEVYPSLDRFHQRQWGQRKEDWIVGNTDEKSRIIRMVSPNNPGKLYNYNSILKVAMHEAIHQLTDLLQKDHTLLPKWLSEGVAGYYSEQLDGDRELLRELIRTKKSPQIEELNGEGFINHNGYEFSAALVEYIVRIYGEEKLRLLLKDPRNLEKELSITMAVLNKNWHEDLAKSYQ
jgi:hypothetical protein